MSTTVSRSDFKNYKRVLIKVGTSVVTHSTGNKTGIIALPRIAYIVEQITRLKSSGIEVILVSSGSVGCGKFKLGETRDDYNNDTNHIYNRGFAAAGQSSLMGIYEYMFSYYNVKCAQILVTDDDFKIDQYDKTKRRKDNLRLTLTMLLNNDVVPILNENDVVTCRNLSIRDNDSKILWDNDSLACLIGIDLNCDLIILLTDVDGLYKQLPVNGDKPAIIDIYNPKTNGINLEIGAKSRVGRGGMEEKIKNAIMAINKGCKAVIIASGKKQDTIDRIIRGENIGTLFVNPKNLTNIQLNPSEIAINARIESRKLCQLTTKERKNILINIANSLENNIEIILQQNKIDLENAEKTNLNKQLLHRLKLTRKKLNVVINGIIQIANYDEPIGKIIKEMQLSQTLNLKQITTPIGVLLVIFESRPDVLPQVISLSIKSGNGLLLKGGSEAIYSNKILYKIISSSITQSTNNIINGSNIVSLIETRKDIKSLLNLDKNKIDLIIPRGSMKFVQFIEKNTSIPVLGHSSGLCHLFIDENTNITNNENLQKIIKIVIDSKCNYPSACNATETLLIHRDFKYMKEIRDALIENNVKINVGPNIQKLSEWRDFEKVKSFKIEYGDLEISVEIVNDISDAINHINTYGSGHTDSIVTDNDNNKILFLNSIDSSCVFINSSTRFADGYRFGLGAEVGISTNRIHARGPVGINGLLTTKWCLVSNDDKNGDIVNDYQNGKKTYIHRLIKSKI